MDLKFLQSELSRISEWVQFADKKAGLISVFYSALLGLLLVKRDDIFLHFTQKNQFDCVYFFFFFLFVLLMVFGVYYLYATVSPRLKNNNTARSLFYYGNIAASKIEDYLKDMESLTDDEAKRQVAEQIHTNSVIAEQKMSHVRKSTSLLLLAGMVGFFLFFLT